MLPKRCETNPVTKEISYPPWMGRYERCEYLRWAETPEGKKKLEPLKAAQLEYDKTHVTDEEFIKAMLAKGYWVERTL